VKQGTDVYVSAKNAIRGEKLGELKKAVDEQFRILNKKERKAYSTLAKMEAEFARKLLNLRKQ